VKSEYTEQQRSIAAEVVNIASGYVEPLCLLSDIIAKLDVLTSFAQVSADAPELYVRPRLLPRSLTDCNLFTYFFVSNSLMSARQSSQSPPQTGPRSVQPFLQGAGM